MKVKFTIECMHKDCDKSLDVEFETPCFEWGQLPAKKETGWILTNPQSTLIDILNSKYADSWFYSSIGPLCMDCYLDSNLDEKESN